VGAEYAASVPDDQSSDGPEPSRLQLRERWRSGELDKTSYAREMRSLHGVLAEYSALLADSRLRGIRISPDDIFVESGWAPVAFHANFGDIGTPISVSLNFGDYEALEMALLDRLLEESQVFFDIGANIGWYTVHAAAMHPGIRVFAVEPVAATYAELVRNIELNELSVTALQLGVSDQPGSAQLQVPAGIAGASSLHLSRDYPDQRSELVALTTIDSLAAESDVDVDVIKIDVEGAELLAFRGGAAVLEKSRPAVIAELLRIHSAAFGYHPNDVLALMRDLGYRCFAATRDGWAPFASMDDDTVETDFALLHPDRHGDVIRTLSIS